MAITTLSVGMDRGMARALKERPAVVAALGTRVERTNDGEWRRINTLSNMSYQRKTDDKELKFFRPHTFHEVINDRNEWNITWETYMRDASKIGGNMKYQEDYMRGMTAGKKVMQDIGNSILNRAMSSTLVNEHNSTAVSIPATSFDSKLEEILIDIPQKLRDLVVNSDQETIVNIFAPVRFNTYLVRYLAGREGHTMGDSVVKGALYSDLYRTRFITTSHCPIDFKITLTTNPANGDTLTLVGGSRYAFMKFVTTLSDDPIGEVQIGTTTAVTLSRIYQYLTTENAVGGTNFGPRANNDVTLANTSGIDKNTGYNYNQNLVTFFADDTDYDSGTTITAYGASGGIEFTAGQATSGSGIAGSVGSFAYKILFAVDGAMVDYIIRDDAEYVEWVGGKNSNNGAIMRHQLYGTFGTGLRSEETVRFRTQKVTFAS